jgi:tRNA threonylcarbamoyladenosine biosynthesis protein TsaB
MKLLLMDACGAAATLALADSARGPAVFAQSTLAERSAAAMLLPAVRDLLAEARVELKDLDAIAVVHGPGSFTGVRIGVSAAKGLSEGSGKPVIAISRLAVLASLCPSERVHPVLDAGRGEFYVGSYRGMECLREDLLTHEAGPDGRRACSGLLLRAACGGGVARAGAVHRR